MIRIEERVTVKVPGVTSLFISFDFNRSIVEELKLIQSSFYDADSKEWEIPLTSLSEFVDRCCIYDDIELIILPDENVESITHELLQYKTQPFEYQLEGIQHGLNNSRWLLLDAPGLGKTLQLIYLAEELKHRNGLEHCLIICGINTLKTNWKTEIEKHSSEKCRILGQRVNRKGELVIDGVQKRVEQLQERIEEFFVVTNIETLRDDRIIKALLKNKPNKFDMVIVDEIHKAKSNTSQQGKNLLNLNKATYRIGATGTLLLNNPLDTYVPLKWIGAEHSTYSNFRYYYCNYGGPFNNEIIGFKNVNILQNQLKKYSLRRTKDILNLPPKTIIPEYVDMSDAQHVFYENVKSGISQEVDKVRLNSANTLAMVARLRQATACPSILTTENIPSAKIERAIDLTEQIVNNGEKVVIFSTFKETVYNISKQLSTLGISCVFGTGDQTDYEIDSSKYAFQNDPDTRVFVGTWQKCGTGITLTAASYMIFIDTPFTAAEFEQACDRIHRIGTSGAVFIYNLISHGTVDERVWEIVNDKEAISDYIIDDKITEKGIASLRKYIEEFI